MPSAHTSDTNSSFYNQLLIRPCREILFSCMDRVNPSTRKMVLRQK